MGKIVNVFYLHLIILFMAFPTPMVRAQQDQDIIMEEVRVVNIEVPVRVVYKGKPVANLKRSDFKLYESGKEQKIHGFFPLKKIIKHQKYDLTADRVVKRKPRYFVLAFRVSNFNNDLKKSIKNFIKNFLYKEDRLLLFINDKTMYFSQIPDISVIYPIIEKNLKDQCRKAKYRFNKYYLKVKKAIDLTRLKALLTRSEGEAILIADDVMFFLKNYLTIWKDYKKVYLIPEVDTFYNFSQLLEKINLEKWVISFYQFEKFPELKLTGKIRNEIRTLISGLQEGRSEDVAKSRMISRLLNSIDRELKVSNDFPSEEISKLFYKANATFHSLFFTSYDNELSPDLECKEVNTDLENSLRLITEQTGGELLVSNKLDTSLKRVVETEDIYYILTYAPDNPNKIGKIKIKVNNKKYDVFYDDNIRADYISTYLKKRKSTITDIKLEKVKFENNIFYFTIFDLVLKEIEGKKSGMVNVHVQIKDEDNKILYDQNKSLKPENTEVNIKISMDWMKKGKYNLIIDVEDLYTQKSAFKYLIL